MHPLEISSVVSLMQLISYNLHHILKASSMESTAWRHDLGALSSGLLVNLAHLKMTYEVR